MVIHLGKSQVFKWQMADALERIVNPRGTGAHIFKKGPELIFAHRCHHSRARLWFGRR
jgi:hypothetical protein